MNCEHYFWVISNIFQWLKGLYCSNKKKVSSDYQKTVYNKYIVPVPRFTDSAKTASSEADLLKPKNKKCKKIHIITYIFVCSNYT